MNLGNGVFYRRYGDITYVRNVPQRMDYIFNGIASDFLDYIKCHPNCKIEDLCNALAEEYELDNRFLFDEDMKSFASELNEIGILHKINKPQPEEDLRDYVRSVVKETRNIFSATIEITYRCNERCIHCYVDDKIDKNQELTLAEHEKLLDELWELGCHNILLTGGEVTLREDFLDIVQIAIQKGFCVDVYTNGLKLTETHIKRLASLYVNSVSFSLYGPNEKIHDAITGVPGSFNRSLFNLMMCKCAGIDTFIKTVVMKQNYSYLEEIMELGKLIGVSVNTSMVITASHTGRDSKQFRLMDAKKYQHVTELSLEYESNNEFLVNVEGHEIGLCGAGSISLSIDPFGNVAPCNAIYKSMGNIREKSLRDIWEQSPILDFLNNLRRCFHKRLSKV